MSEKALVDHIFVRLESQVQDYVEVRNPQNAIQLLEVLAKFEERYSCKATLGSRNSDNVEGRGWNQRKMSNVGNNRGNWRNSEVVNRPNNGRNDYRGNYQNLVLSSRDQLIEQRTDPELGHIYRYLENPEDSSVNGTICENWSRDFRLVEGLLFHAKYATSLGEMRVYIPKSLRNEIMREFHDKPLAGHFARFKTYHKIRDVCYFPYMRKIIDQYASTWHMCQINNYKNALPAGRLIPIVSNYSKEIVTLDLLGP
ncbi:uncharacterized protein TNCV_5084141 [Trichonephila clavipes]|nr:uncharacterized protein TNCV_5084141 [Trichonephila clavipes]